MLTGGAISNSTARRDFRSSMRTVLTIGPDLCVRKTHGIGHSFFNRTRYMGKKDAWIWTAITSRYVQGLQTSEVDFAQFYEMDLAWGSGRGLWNRVAIAAITEAKFVPAEYRYRQLKEYFAINVVSTCFFLLAIKLCFEITILLNVSKRFQILIKLIHINFPILISRFPFLSVPFFLRGLPWYLKTQFP